MSNQEITVVYQWTAKPGKADELQAIYRQVTEDMKNNEPGALNVQCYFDPNSDTLVVSDLFENGAALGLHLGTTARNHFPGLLEIANPGQFIFCGEVPVELKEAAIQMGLNALFAPGVFGFRKVHA